MIFLINIFSLNLTFLEQVLILVIIFMVIKIIRLYKVAHYDFLTNVGNRLKCVKDLNKKLGKGYGIYIDVNNLKVINDNYGHSYGDEMLIATALYIGKVIGNDGQLYRIGGDEFFIFINTTINDEAVKILEQLIKPTSIKIEGESHELSYSVGACFFHDFIPSVEVLFDITDKAQYKIKKNGKKGWHMMDYKMAKVYLDKLKKAKNN